MTNDANVKERNRQRAGLYKRPGSPYFWLKFMADGRMRFYSTKETVLRKAEIVRDEIRGKFFRDHAERKAKAEQLGCAVESIAACPECDRLFDSTRAVIALKGMKVCSDPCRRTWNSKDADAQPPTLKNFFEKKFLPAKRSGENTDGAKTYYEDGCTFMSKFDLVNRRIDEITSEHVAAFVADAKASKTRVGERPSPSTINRALRTLKHALRKAEEWGTIAKVPRFRLEKERRRERVLSDAEFDAYTELAGQPWADIAVILRYEGFRPAEVYALRWEHVRFLDGRGWIRIVRGKSANAKRQLPMLPPVYEVLKRLHEAADKPKAGFLFPAATKQGHILGPGKFEQRARATLYATWTAAKRLNGSANGNWARAVADAAKASLTFDVPALTEEFVARHADVIRAGGDEFCAYSLRHTCLTRFAEAGCDAFTLAKIAGHGSIAMTSRYVHPGQRAIEDAFADVPFRKQLPA
ncbi:MAG: tyrosine-type recombinase/integrase [Terriglobales bacterium]